MDQTAPADHSILRDQRERSEDANLDRFVRLGPRRHRPEASRAGRRPLPNSTDLERDAIRENAHFTGPSGLRLRRRFTRRQQPIDSIRLLAGQQWTKIKPPERNGGALGISPGSFLVSHTLARAVPSGLRGLTAVFGMGTGGSLSLWPPRNWFARANLAL